MKVRRLCEFCMAAACLNANGARAIQAATHIVMIEQEGEKTRVPACEPHRDAAQRYRKLHGLAMHAPLRVVEPIEEPQRFH